MHSLAEYLYSHGDWDRRNSGEHADLDSTKPLDLHAAETAALKQLDVNWDKVEDTINEGAAWQPKLTMVSVAQWYG